MILYTIGVYNSTEKEFFEKITSNNIDVFCDIRQRRGVRGSKYKFVNSKRLQKELSNLNIRYMHIKQLSPSIELRNIQKATDKLSHQYKHNRNKLGDDFIEKYKEIIIKNYDFDSLISWLHDRDFKNIVFFCIEETPQACHRSIVSEELNNKNYTIKHL